MADPEVNPAVREFLAGWAQNIFQLLGQLGVETPSATSADPVPASPPAPDAQPNLISARFVCGGGLRGELLWLAEKPAALLLAQVLMSETPDSAIEFSDTHRDAFAELLRQVAGLMATSWKQATGREALISFHSAAEPAFAPALESAVRISGAKIPEISLRLQLNAELSAALSAVPPTAPEPPQEGAQDSGDPPAVGSSSAQAPATSLPLPSNLDLLLDVELEATIRFGEREMLLREIMALMPGAVVELDQLVSEPADLLVAGRLVARGEVVVVDGNFGLRITEVASRSQRAELVPGL